MCTCSVMSLPRGHSEFLPVKILKRLRVPTRIVREALLANHRQLFLVIAFSQERRMGWLVGNTWKRLSLTPGNPWSFSCFRRKPSKREILWSLNLPGNKYWKCAKN